MTRLRKLTVDTSGSNAFLASNHNLLDRPLAHQARLTFSPIDPMLELEEALFSVGVYVVGNRRPSGGDGLLQHLLQSMVQLGVFRTRDGGRPPPGPNSGAEQAFICVDVSHSMQQLLVQQRRLDRRLARAKKLHEFFDLDLKRLRPWSGKAAHSNL